MGAEEPAIKLRFTQRFLRRLKDGDAAKKAAVKPAKDAKEAETQRPTNAAVPSSGSDMHHENASDGSPRGRAISPLTTDVGPLPFTLPPSGFPPPGLPPPIPFPPGTQPVQPGVGLGLSQEQRRGEQKDKEMAAYRRALMDSERVGALLVKKETDELKRVGEFADQLHKKHYRPPSRPIPCSEEREACVHCYAENAKDPVKCAENVKAFVECSRRTHRVTSLRSPFFPVPWFSFSFLFAALASSLANHRDTNSSFTDPESPALPPGCDDDDEDQSLPGTYSATLLLSADRSVGRCTSNTRTRSDRASDADSVDSSPVPEDSREVADRRSTPPLGGPIRGLLSNPLPHIPTGAAHRRRSSPVPPIGPRWTNRPPIPTAAPPLS
ncbi:hypothetical protein CBR_g50926 [Chara braunii]|uniref:CHCH domain-containing protein n=1 Tax=Chara braunii TaxID=69332 RepID=A0A388M7W8_CHABU|nr:hypothetical protein CBR_g50926 [Chara braunii]|eukprot:GBG90583.1 hypothetical protein CBR_g50926 [Chara braunii]